MIASGKPDPALLGLVQGLACKAMIANDCLVFTRQRLVSRKYKKSLQEIQRFNNF